MRDQRFPVRVPFSGCSGWLVHNLQRCHCYEADREREAASARTEWIADNLSPLIVVAVLLLLAAGIVGLTG